MSQLTISTKEKRFPVAPDLYGLFFEDISHAGDGGLYPEMLRNRSFEDSLLPDGCITNEMAKHLLLQQDGLMSSTMARE